MNMQPQHTPQTSGLEQGRTERKARTEGQSGRKEGIKETAKNMLKRNIEVEIIEEVTGLSKEEIEKLV